jgi:hypothetical protein
VSGITSAMYLGLFCFPSHTAVMSRGFAESGFTAAHHSAPVKPRLFL